MNPPQWLALVSVVGGLGGLAVAAVWAHWAYYPNTVTRLWMKLVEYPVWLALLWFLAGIAVGMLIVHLYEMPPGWPGKKM